MTLTAAKLGPLRMTPAKRVCTAIVYSFIGNGFPQKILTQLTEVGFPMARSTLLNIDLTWKSESFFSFIAIISL